MLAKNFFQERFIRGDKEIRNPQKYVPQVLSRFQSIFRGIMYELFPSTNCILCRKKCPKSVRGLSGSFNFLEGGNHSQREDKISPEFYWCLYMTM